MPAYVPAFVPPLVQSQGESQAEEAALAAAVEASRREAEEAEAAQAIQMSIIDAHHDNVARAAAAQPEAVPPPVRCSICLDDLYGDSVHPVHMLKCAHAFHSKCIMQWGDKANARGRTCPMCRDRGGVPKTPRSGM